MPPSFLGCGVAAPSRQMRSWHWDLSVGGISVLSNPDLMPPLPSHTSLRQSVESMFESKVSAAVGVWAHMPVLVSQLSSVHGFLSSQLTVHVVVVVVVLVVVPAAPPVVALPDAPPVVALPAA